MFPRNVFPITSEINDAGHLVIGGCDAVDLGRGVRHPSLHL